MTLLIATWLIWSFLVFFQRPGIDFGEIFSPAVKSDTINIILSIVVSQD
jgi:hypothetical protein